MWNVERVSCGMRVCVSVSTTSRGWCAWGGVGGGRGVFEREVRVEQTGRAVLPVGVVCLDLRLSDNALFCTECLVCTFCPFESYNEKHN